jgi:peptidoglycan/xylan/chitin deacetylase (PgdA/CDA1 family)
MSWTQIHEMHRGGITFGAHTRTHVDLAQAAPDLARQEIEESRVALERELGTPVKVFAYPFGLYNDAARLIVQEDGFEGACSTRPGLNTLATSNFELHRCEVRGTDSLLHFTRCLLLGSDHVKRRT